MISTDFNVGDRILFRKPFREDNYKVKKDILLEGVIIKISGDMIYLDFDKLVKENKKFSDCNGLRFWLIPFRRVAALRCNGYKNDLQWYIKTISSGNSVVGTKDFIKETKEKEIDTFESYLCKEEVIKMIRDLEEGKKIKTWIKKGEEHMILLQKHQSFLVFEIIKSPLSRRVGRRKVITKNYSKSFEYEVIE